jgi:hypothetical protein
VTDTQRRQVGPIETVPLFAMEAELEEPLEVGAGPIGRRVINRVRRGSFDGPRLRGAVVPGSADWALYRADGVMAIDARVTLRTDDGALIQMTYAGRAVIPDEVRPLLADRRTRHEVDPARYYFRCTPLFETGADDYRWLNGLVAVGAGYLVAGGGVGYQISALQ